MLWDGPWMLSKRRGDGGLVVGNDKRRVYHADNFTNCIPQMIPTTFIKQSGKRTSSRP